MYHICIRMLPHHLPNSSTFTSRKSSACYLKENSIIFIPFLFWIKQLDLGVYLASKSSQFMESTIMYWYGSQKLPKNCRFDFFERVETKEITNISPLPSPLFSKTRLQKRSPSLIWPKINSRLSKSFQDKLGWKARNAIIV